MSYTLHCPRNVVWRRRQRAAYKRGIRVAALAGHSRACDRFLLLSDAIPEQRCPATGKNSVPATLLGVAQHLFIGEHECRLVNRIHLSKSAERRRTAAMLI